MKVYYFSVQVLRVHFFGGLSYPPRGESGVGELSMRILQYLVNEKVKYLQMVLYQEILEASIRPFSKQTLSNYSG